VLLPVLEEGRDGGGERGVPAGVGDLPHLGSPAPRALRAAGQPFRCGQRGAGQGGGGELLELGVDAQRRAGAYACAASTELILL
jgi:hypothetical protein